MGDALVATASGQDESTVSAKVMANPDHLQRAREQVVGLLTTCRFGTADLAAMRRVLDALEKQARDQETAARHELNHGVLKRAALAQCGWS